MWMPRAVVTWLNISLDTVNDLKAENAALKAENSRLESELLSTKVNLDWLRVQYNQVQLERVAMLEKTYNIRVPAPALQASKPKPPSGTPSIEEMSLFDDMGDAAAKLMGLPSFDS
jgi:hypothetical protein